MRMILLLLLAGFSMAEDAAVKMAAQGRLHLIVPGESEPLKDVKVSIGSATNASWLDDESARERFVDVTFPIDWWRWREVKLGFTPASDGVVELYLSGPWAEKSPGTIFRQEVLWDSIEGGGVKNGDFAGIGDWEAPWRPYPDAEEWPLEGREIGASWHDRPLLQKLKLKKGERVEISLKVRAATPPGFIEPKKLGSDTAAHRALAKLRCGVNLGNGWEAPPGEWGVEFVPADIDRIAAAGFDHVRVPVSWQNYLTDGGISSAHLSKLEPVLKRALEKRMTVILNWHHFDELAKDPEGTKKQFVEGWQTVAKHFSDWPPELYFELLNEPHGALEGELLNSLQVAVIGVIRESNPKRILLVDPDGWASTDGLGALRLPEGDERIIVSFHCYDPFRFTHQGASWVNMEDVKDVKFPGDDPPGFEQRFDDARTWSDFFGRPVHLGEFGAIREADPDSRKRYAKAVRTAAELRGIPWCWWEWKAGFGCWDAEEGKALLIDELTGG